MLANLDDDELLDRLDWTMDFLGGAAQLLMGIDHNEEGFEYVIEKLRQDLVFINDPVRQLISERRYGRRKARKLKLAA